MEVSPRAPSREPSVCNLENDHASTEPIQARRHAEECVTTELRLDESGDAPSTLLRLPLDQGDDEHPSNESGHAGAIC